MITKLEIENFYSIKNRQVLDLVVPGNAPAKASHLVETWVGSQERVPKIVAIFWGQRLREVKRAAGVKFHRLVRETQFFLP